MQTAEACAKTEALILAGSATGVATAFNTPFAGIELVPRL
jgi:H+/Cl- antiporter ClcA